MIESVYFGGNWYILLLEWLEWAINMQLANPNNNIITKKTKYQPLPLKESWKRTDWKEKTNIKHKRTKIKINRADKVVVGQMG